MKTPSLNLPDEINEKELKMSVAAMLFEEGILSSGQAAAMAGITKRQFLETAGKYGVSIFGETSSDIKPNPFDE